MCGTTKTAACLAACMVVLTAGCTGQGDPVDTQVAEIFFETTQVTDAGAGQFYSELIRFGTGGGAALPDRFDLKLGVLPPGLSLINDRGLDAQGNPDAKGALTGHARLIGYAREQGSFTFTVKAISTGALGGLAQNTDQPDLTVSQEFTLNVGEGSINFITPTAAEGTADPAVPAFPEAIDFVNPANPSAFYSFPVLVAGGSGNNLLNLYLPRELGLSVFDENVINGIDALDFDTDETAGSGSKMENHAGDGGWFVLQAGNSKVQVGGFQSPRGVVGTIAPLDPDRFQRTPGQNGPALNSRRTIGENVPGGDTTLGTPQPVNFSDYFHDRYEGTHPSFTAPPGQPDLLRRMYPFTAAEYHNAFFMPFTEGVDLTPLRFRMIAQAIDTRGTVGVKTDDVISRKAYAVQVQIPDIVMDTVFLPAGTAGIEYTVFVNASGGVPPLELNLEYVDSTIDGELTENGPNQITKASFGVEADSATGQFFGIPNASGLVEFTLRASAAVMNPVQGGTAYVPTPNPGEFNGTNPVTGKAGIHRTIAVFFATPSAPVLTNLSLAPGVDGQPYPGDRLVGSGGVPKVVPPAVGFVGTYPSSQVVRTYTWTASYVRDTSYPGFEGTVDPGRSLPNALDLDGDASSPTNGQITGTPYDRGFHPVSITQTDFYLGDASAPSALNGQVVTAQRALSISPDTAVFMRGAPTSEGGVVNGLLDGTAQMTESRMVPLFLAASVYQASVGEQPQRNTDLPAQIDLLPVLLANGGSDAHVDKSIPSVSGFWPAESNKNDRWEYYYYGNVEPYYGWKHLQQEHTWIQTPTPEQYRVFLWSETKLKKYSGPYGNYGSNYVNPTKYQIVDRASGKRRGVMVLNPLTGDFWIPAILTNSNTAHGVQFGTEDVWGTSSRGIVYSSYSNTYAYMWGYLYGGSYTKYYGYMYAGNQSQREARLSGGGTFIRAYGRLMHEGSYGRTSNSVAVSADGLWGATALPGPLSSSGRPKILVWRNDKQPIPAAFGGQGHVTMLSGVDAKGNTLTNSACIIEVSAYGSDQRYLLPDSLMFVRGGLLFLMEKRLSYIHGVSLADGSLSTKSVNARTALSSQQGVGATTSSTSGITYADNPSTSTSSTLTNWDGGQPVPDQDFVLGQKRVMHSSVQFSFTGNKPGDGEAGPSKVAFIAGRLYNVVSPMDAYAVRYNQSNAAYYRLSDDAVRKGMSQGCTGTKAVLFLEIPGGQQAPASSYGPGGSGLNLAAGGTTIKDLTGHETRICGDFLTPGRLGEELDFVSVSPDGKYVAAVRNCGYSGRPQSGTGQVYSYYYYSYGPTYGSISTSTTTSTSYYQSSKDILVFSTEGKDLDTGGSTSATPQTVLYLGTGRMGSTNESGSINNIDYASARSHLNAYGRRIAGVQFTPDSKSLIFTYQAHNSYNPNYFGSAYQYTINATSRTSTYHPATARMSVRFDFRTSSDGPINFASSPNNFLKNMLQGLSGVGSVGDTSVPFGSAAGGVQQFWATFKSQNGKFLYYVSDQTNGRNYMVGFNISGAKVGTHDPWVPFSPHASNIGFEQFDCNSWNYENRFFAVPAGVLYPPSGRDGGGIVFLIGSDASSGATSATDLEVYAFDANVGGDLVALTSSVTTGTQNAVNHMYASACGNFVVAQRCQTNVNSSGTRAKLNGESDLMVVTNVHAALGGATPNAFILSAGKSHGASVAFVGENTSTGPQALIFSSAPKGNNTTWDDRTLKMAVLSPGTVPDELDSTKSHYVVMAGTRKLDDDPNGPD